MVGSRVPWKNPQNSEAVAIFHDILYILSTSVCDGVLSLARFAYSRNTPEGM